MRIYANSPRVDAVHFSSLRAVLAKFIRISSHGDDLIGLRQHQTDDHNEFSRKVAMSWSTCCDRYSDEDGFTAARIDHVGQAFCLQPYGRFLKAPFWLGSSTVISRAPYALWSISGRQGQQRRSSTGMLVQLRSRVLRKGPCQVKCCGLMSCRTP